VKKANVFLPTVVAVLFFMLSGCSGIRTMDTSGIKAFTITSTSLSCESADLVRDITAGKDVVFKIPAGQTLPLQINIDMPMAETKGVPNEIRFKRDTYFFVSQNRMLISPDGIRWAPIHDLDAIKKLYGWSRGSLSFGLSASKKQKTRLEMALKAE
jgi:hypothetical protein